MWFREGQYSRQDFSRSTCRVLQRSQVLDEFALLFCTQLQFEVIVIMVHDSVERRESSVMVEAALVNLLRVEQRSQRRRDISSIRATISLKTVDAVSGAV
jgi:hypothetical protein